LVWRRYFLRTFRLFDWGIILDSDHADNFFRVFYLRRALRILPVAFLAIAFCYWFIPFIDLTVLRCSQVPPYAYLLFVSNFWTANGLHAYVPLGPLWSLAIEEQFHLIAPAFILLVNSRARNMTLLVIVFISPIVRMYNFRYSSWDFTLFRLDGFSAGILVVALLREAHLKEFATRHLMTINALVFSICIAALIFSIASGLSFRERVAVGISLNSPAAAGVILSLHPGVTADQFWKEFSITPHHTHGRARISCVGRASFMDGPTWEHGTHFIPPETWVTCGR
jgi:peptidoglycan/LPS O-acetylase OafA/YrhL